ncbi:protein of unknown function [Burkholderia multivorans]
MKKLRTFRPKQADRKTSERSAAPTVPHLTEVLVHAMLELDSVNGLLVVDDGGDGAAESWRIDNRKTAGLIALALRGLGVNTDEPLSVRRISSDSDLECADRNSVPSTKRP